MNLRLTPQDALNALRSEDIGGAITKADEIRNLQNQLAQGPDIDLQTALDNKLRDVQSTLEEQGKLEEYASMEELTPPEWDEDGDGEMDVAFARACPDCEALKPCCMKKGSIEDSTDASRKVVWPPLSICDNENNDVLQDTLLTVAKDVEGRHLVSKVKAKWEGRDCPVGHAARPRIDTTGLADLRAEIVNSDTEVSVGYPQMLSLAMALKDYVPEHVIYALLAFDAIYAIKSIQENDDGAEFTPFQCISDSSMGTALRVIPIPYTKLDGKIELATRISITTGGVSAKAEAKSTLTGIYGSYKIEDQSKATASENSGKVPDDGAKVPGLIGTISDMIVKMDTYTGLGNTKREKVDLTQFASGIHLSKSLVFEPKGFELTAKTGCPDLELKIGSLTSTLSLGVEGKLDIIDAVVTGYTGGAGARKVQAARARMAAGETINGKLEAYLKLAATGTLTHTIDSGASVIIPAKGDPSLALAGLSQTFGGEMKILGEAKVAIEIGVDVWVFKGKAGASGSIHTSWKWKMRNQDGKRQKKYEFEGVVLSAKAYVKADVVTNTRDGSHTSLSLNAEVDGDAQAGDLFEQVRDAITGSAEEATAMANQRQEAGPADGTNVTIWGPEETEWEDY